MDEYRRLVRSCVRVQTKAENNNNMDHVVIKMTNVVSPMFSILKVSFLFSFIQIMLEEVIYRARVAHLLANLGWVDLDLESSLGCGPQL